MFRFLRWSCSVVQAQKNLSFSYFSFPSAEMIDVYHIPCFRRVLYYYVPFVQRELTPAEVCGAHVDARDLHKCLLLLSALILNL